MMANVNHRSQCLFEDGYRSKWLTEDIVEVKNPGGACYQVSLFYQTCDCPFFVEREGKWPCKHLVKVTRQHSRPG